MCENKTTCDRYMRSGPCACSRCHRTTGEETGRQGNAEGEEPVEDAYGNTGDHEYEVRCVRNIAEETYIRVRADCAEDALSRARDALCDDDGSLEWGETDYDTDVVEASMV